VGLLLGEAPFSHKCKCAVGSRVPFTHPLASAETLTRAVCRIASQFEVVPTHCHPGSRPNRHNIYAVELGHVSPIMYIMHMCEACPSNHVLRHASPIEAYLSNPTTSKGSRTKGPIVSPLYSYYPCKMGEAQLYILYSVCRRGVDRLLSIRTSYIHYQQ
jgi:hypothetical protein